MSPNRSIVGGARWDQGGGSYPRYSPPTGAVPPGSVLATSAHQSGRFRDAAATRRRIRAAPLGLSSSLSTLHHGKGVNMADKSPRKIASKKSGKTLKEKRQAKKVKKETRKGLTQH